ncbi:MAG: hypothetical protein IIA61_02750 [Candidatus Marinimicrobia bacterium]|nr:hypothetical protein [Candidatus Neomarinimicrobiota bacterium]
MKKQRLLFLVSLFLLTITFITCNKNPTDDKDSPKWEALGYRDRFESRLVMADPYLYVCGAIDGLWRKNVRQEDADWEYLGLADPAGSWSNGNGVRHVVIHQENPDWLMVTFNTGGAGQHKIYRSLDGGQNWARADSGVSSPGSIQLFLQYPDRILGGGLLIYSNQDFGNHWEIVANGRQQVNIFANHPIAKHICWMGGTTAFSRGFLFKSANSGRTWEEIDLQQVIPSVNVIYNIAFDATNSDMVYVGMSSGIIKSSDGGQSWINIAGIDTIYSVLGLVADPRSTQHLWAGSAVQGKAFWETWDAGNSWQPIEVPNDDSLIVYDIVWDEVEEVLYVATPNDIFQFTPE